MREVGRPLAEMSQYGRLDGLHSFRLFRVVGDPVLRAVGVRHKQRPLTVVAAAGAHRFAFLLPNRALASAAPCSGVLTGPAILAQLSCVCGELSCVLAAEITQSCGAFSLTEQRPQLESAVHRSTTPGKPSFFAGLMDANCYLKTYLLRVCVILAALWPTRLALPPVHQAVCRAHAKRPGTTPWR